MAALNFGDLVWAKMKGYAYWPGRVVNPPSNAKIRKGHHYVFFFGSENYGWVPLMGVVPYAENIDTFSTKTNTALFRKAVKDIESFADFVATSESENEATDDEEEIPKSDEVISKTVPEVSESHQVIQNKDVVQGDRNKDEGEQKFQEVVHNQSEDGYKEVETALQRSERIQKKVLEAKRKFDELNTQKESQKGIDENAQPRRKKRKVSSRTNKSDANEKEIIWVKQVDNRKLPVPFIDIKIESDHDIDQILDVPVGDDEEYDKYCRVQTFVLGNKPPTLQKIPDNISFLSKIVASRKAARGGQVNDVSCPESEAEESDYFVPKSQTDHKKNPSFEDTAKQTLSTKPLVPNILSAKSCNASSDFEDIVSEQIRRPVVLISKEDQEICAQKLAALSSDPYFDDTDDHEVEDGELKATNKVIGFIGLGRIGKGVVNNLLRTGHKVNIWNRTAEKCQEFISKGADAFDTPSNLVQSSDIVFICVANMQAANEVIFGRDGIADGLSIKVNSRKGVVNMTSISPEKSKEIFNMLDEKNTDYLEAQVDGSSIRANLGELRLMCSGSISLYRACGTCFKAMSGDIGPILLTSRIEDAPKMKLIFGVLRGSLYVGLQEAVTCVQRCDLNMEHFLQIFKASALNCQALINEGFEIMKRELKPNTLLYHVQNDLALGVKLSHTSKEPMPVACAANEVYRKAKRLECGNKDGSSMSLLARKQFNE